MSRRHGALVVWLFVFILSGPFSFPANAAEPKTISLKDFKGVILSVAFSPDGKTLATGGGMFRFAPGGEKEFSEVTLRDAVTGKKRATLSGHKSIVYQVAFSPDGKLLATAAGDDNELGLRLWDVATGKELRAFKARGVRQLAFSPNGKTLASVSGLVEIKLWDPMLGKEKAVLKGHRFPITALAYSPDGKILASCSTDKTVRFWDPETGKEVALLQHADLAQSLAFSADGKTLAVGADDGIHLWSVADRKEQKVLKGDLKASITSLAFLPNKPILLSGSNKGMTLWDLEKGEKIVSQPSRISCVALGPRGQMAMGNYDRTVTLWSTQEDKPANNEEKDDPALPAYAKPEQARALLQGHKGHVQGLAFSPDSKTLATGGKDRIIRLWDVATAKQVASLEGHTSDINAVAFSADGKLLASVGGDRKVLLWDVAKRKLVTSLPAGRDRLTSVAFSPDGKTLAAGSWDKNVHLWDYTTGKKLHLLFGHTSVVNCVAFSPNGKQLASGSWDKRVMLWDVATGDPDHLVRHGHASMVTAVRFSPDGSRFASASFDRSASVYNVKQLESERDLLGKPRFMHDQPVSALAYSPKGQMILTGSSKIVDEKHVGLLTFWTTSGNEITAFRCPSTIFSVEFAPNGKTIASGSVDGAVILWEPPKATRSGDR